MKKFKFITVGLGLSALPITFVPVITSCGNKPSSDIKVTNISLEGKNYVLTNRSYSYTAKVLPENATNKEITWSIEKPTESTAEVTVDQNGSIKFTKAGEANLVATAKDGSKVTTSIKIYGLDETQAQEISKYYFCNDPWSEICDFANQGYDALLNHYAGLKTLSNPFIGLERTITLNGQKHVVRVIGENHDTITGTSNKAALTFELINVLTDKDGNAITSTFNPSTAMNNDYQNSALRKNLTGSGTYSKKEDLWSESALQMLKTGEPLLFNNLKSVTKEVACGASYEVKSYDDKLFPLTYTEMAQSGSEHATVEGTAYKFWENNEVKTDPLVGRIKTPVGKTIKEGSDYFLNSPCITVAVDCVWNVGSNGTIVYDYQKAINSTAVSFAFCI